MTGDVAERLRAACATAASGDSAAHLLQAAVARAALRIVESDAVIRADVDPEGVHQARVGCRRLRSDLRTFRSLVDGDWARSLRDELGWLAAELGAVRDLDVLGVRLASALATLAAPERDDAAAASALVASERSAALGRLLVAMDGSRHGLLLDRLADAAASPRTVDAADRPAADVVAPLAGVAFAKLRAEAKRMPRRPADDELHALRIRAKRARYAAELAAPAIGAPAEGYAKAVARLQEVLGDHHDAVVTAAWVRAAAAGTTPAQAFAFGLLCAGQRAQADALRPAWRRAWRRVDRSDLTAWMRR